MAAKKSSAGKAGAALTEGDLASTVVSETVAPEPSASDQYNEQMAREVSELKELVRSLADTVRETNVRNAQSAEFKSTLAEIRQVAAAIPSAGGYGVATPQPAPVKESCHDGCECVDCACCTFEIWMSHVRVDQMQIEPGDTNLVPTNVLEVWMFASIDPIHNIGICIPDPGPQGNIALHKQITDPYGPWVSVNRCVGTVTVKKGAPLIVPVSLTAVEREVTFVEMAMPLNREEWGSNTGNVTLDCCYSNYSPIDVPVLMTSWGQGGGAVTGRFIVVKRC